MSSVELGAGTAADRAFLGHPRGLGYLVFAEAWERFSYYGMQALLVLYMGQQLLLPGHVEHVAGFTAFRAAIEHTTGPLSTAALASMIFGLYASGVYLTPIVGGLIADLVGRTPTITFGACIMALGHFLMAFDVSFLAALACLLIGVGCFKGNIASQVGQLYAANDLRRADAFQIFLLGVNVAVIISPLVCGTLGQKVAWHYGFGAAGIGMLIGLTVYLSGRRWLPADRPRGRDALQAPKIALSGAEFKAVLVLIAVLPALAISALGNQQIYNAYLVWGDANFNLVFFGKTMPVTWLISLDAFVSSGTILLVVAFWRWWGSFRREPDEITKLVIGALISALAPLLLSFASAQEAATGHKVGLGWGIAFHVINDIGFSNVFPVGLALFTRASPKKVGGLMIGVYYLHLSACNLMVGRLGGLLEKMGGTQFWLLHAALVAGGGVVLLLIGLLFGRLLSPVSEAPADEAAAA
jgi:POT family proton-dependent oligopeptide transporter